MISHGQCCCRVPPSCCLSAPASSQDHARLRPQAPPSEVTAGVRPDRWVCRCQLVVQQASCLEWVCCAVVFVAATLCLLHHLQAPAVPARTDTVVYCPCCFLCCRAHGLRPPTQRASPRHTTSRWTGQLCHKALTLEASLAEAATPGTILRHLQVKSHSWHTH